MEQKETETIHDSQISEEEHIEMTEQLKQQEERFLRLQADYENFKRRTIQEKEAMAKYASEKVFLSLLPIIDNFERALKSGEEQQEDSQALSKGIEMIFKQLTQMMQDHGLEAVECLGKVFDPHEHQAIAQVACEDCEEGIVVEELQKGYRLKDKLLRPAMVKVSE